MKYFVIVFLSLWLLWYVFLNNQTSYFQEKSESDTIRKDLNSQNCQNEDLSCERIWRISHNLIDTRWPRNDPHNSINPEVKNRFEYQYTWYFYTWSDSETLLLRREKILDTNNVVEMNNYREGLLKKWLTLRLMAPANGLDPISESYVLLDMAWDQSWYVALLYDDNIYQWPWDGSNIYMTSIVFDDSLWKMKITAVKEPVEAMVNVDGKDAYDINSEAMRKTSQTAFDQKEDSAVFQENSNLLQFFPLYFSE